METTIENRGSLPPEFFHSNPGYMETSVDIISDNCILPKDNSFPTSASDWDALKIVAKADKRIYCIKKAERKQTMEFRRKMQRESRERCRRKKRDRFFEMIIAACLIAEIIISVMI